MQRITIPAIACCAALAAAAADFGHFPSTAHIIPFCGAIALTDGCSSLTPSSKTQTMGVYALGIPGIAVITHSEQTADNKGEDTNAPVQANPVTTTMATGK